MSEACAVCKIGKNPTLCEICGFSDNGVTNREFPIIEDANYWLETLVMLYRTKWEAKKREVELLGQIEEFRKKEEEANKREAKLSARIEELQENNNKVQRWEEQGLCCSCGGKKNILQDSSSRCKSCGTLYKKSTNGAFKSVEGDRVTQDMGISEGSALCPTGQRRPLIVFGPLANIVKENNVKFRNLFEAYAQGKLPFAHGYIVSSFFSSTSNYSIYEIVSYSGVKEIFMTETGLQFVTGGKKLYILVEPDTYQIKFQEPVSRAEGEKIPKRFNELEIITARNQSKIMVAKEPNETYGSFTILKPSGINFSVVFYQLPDVYETLSAFFTDSLNRFRKVPESDAKAAAKLITTTVKKKMSFVDSDILNSIE